MLSLSNGQFCCLVLAPLLLYASAYRRLATSVLDDLEKGYDRSLAELDEGIPGEERRSLNDAAHRVTSLPGLDDTSILHYSGHITIDESKGSNIFYWLFEAPNNADNLPLLVWLNGGPGCSSMDGLWLELGPLRLDSSTGRVNINKHSWHNAANILFIDQPVGTGFAYTKSKSGYASSDEAVNSDFYKFLLGFFKLHPRYVNTEKGHMKTRAFYMSGESHAGHYIPTMAAYIMKRNEALQASSSGGDPIISLEGISLGNPWLDPYYQYDASDFAHGLGLINLGQKYRLKEQEKKCHSLLAASKYNNAVCFALLDRIVDSTAVGASERVLMYDTRKFVRQTSSFPPGHEPLERYLNRPDVKAAIHASSTPHKFEECANPPFYALSHQDGKGITKELGEVLDKGLRVLVFAGQYDLICNHLGIERVLRRLPWRGQKDWALAAPGTWAPEGKPWGFVRAHQNLEFLIVLDAGHMVPMDQPAIALRMISAFLQNKRFSATTSQAKLGVSLHGPEGETERCERNISSAVDTSGSSSSSGSGSGGLMSGLSFWPSQRTSTGSGAHLRKTKGKGGSRRNFALASATQSPQRLLSAETPSTHPPHHHPHGPQSVDHTPVLPHQHHGLAYALVLGHATPLNGSVLLHIRLVHHAAAAHLQQHHHLDASAAAQALAGMQFHVLIEPGHRAVLVDLQALLSNHLAADVTIDGLKDGQEYTFTTQYVDAHGVVHPSSKRVVTATPGCFHPTALQCCGNGACVPAVAAASGEGGVCRCDVGYTGPGCDHIAQVGAVVSPFTDSTVTCPAHFHSHAAIVLKPPAPLQDVATVGDKPMHAPVNAGAHIGMTVTLLGAAGISPNGTTAVNYCAFSTSENSAEDCVVSVEVQLRLSTDSSVAWLAPQRFNAHYRSAAATLLRADVLVALESTLPLQLMGVQETVTEEGSLTGSQSKEVARFGTNADLPTAADVKTQAFYVRLQGHAAAVNQQTALLLQALVEPTSQLQTQGAIAAHLSPSYVVSSLEFIASEQLQRNQILARLALLAMAASGVVGWVLAWRVTQEGNNRSG